MESKNIRKACDLCYRKRIKCDGQRPRCSNCQTYSCECTHEAARRKKKKKNNIPPAAVSGDRAEQQQVVEQQQKSNDVATEQQLFGAACPLLQSFEQEHALDASLLALAPPPPVAVDAVQFQQSMLNLPLSLPQVNTLPHTCVSTGRPREFELPPEETVRHIIGAYLATFNSAMPLFHPDSLYRLVGDWYRQPSDSQPAQREPSAWAIINIVLALGQCHGHSSLGPASAHAPSVSECLENAQSVLVEVLAGDMDLQHVQILLGLGILFLGLRPDDVRPAMTFVSTAMRHAQAMGMHRNDYYDYIFDGNAPPEAIQRRRVFWIAYILDRDVAARTRQPPIQQDADMDIDFPPDGDDAGAVYVGQGADAGKSSFNLFRARVELAQIQGRVYDCALSVRASQMDPGESARLAQGIRVSIQQWKARVPDALSVDALTLQSQADTVASHGSSPYLPVAMCYMHSLIIACLGQLCRVNSMDFHWIDKVLSYACGIGDGKEGPSGPSGPHVSPNFASFASSVPPPPQPQGWNVLVNECRDFMRLFQSVHSRHPAFVNIQLCSFASGLLCLSVNSFLNFEDGNRPADQRLMAGAACILSQAYEQTQLGPISKVLEVHAELDFHLMVLTNGVLA